MKKLYMLAAVAMLPVCAAHADADAARAVMQQTTDHVIERLHAEAKIYAEDEQRLYAMIEEVVLPVLDMHLISRLALGSHWKSVSELQRQRFIRSFQAMVMKSYGKTLLLLPGIQIEYELPPPAEPRKRYQIVRTKVMTNDNKAPLSINYSLIDREGWKVFDIIIDGTSLAKQFRNGFDQEIREVGFEALLERLSKFDTATDGS